jgi:glycine/D-amino acid oxidase-like deaminating enzyme
MGIAVDDGQVERRPGLSQADALKVLRITAGLSEHPPKQVKTVIQALYGLRRGIEALQTSLRKPSRADEVLSALREGLGQAAAKARLALQDGKPAEGFEPLKKVFTGLNNDLDWISETLDCLNRVHPAIIQLGQSLEARQDTPADDLRRILDGLLSPKDGAARPELMKQMPKSVANNSETGDLARNMIKAIREFVGTLPPDVPVVKAKKSLKEAAADCELGDPWSPPTAAA